MKKPVILGVAVTNRPHIRLKGHPMEIVNKEWFLKNNIVPPRELEEDETLIRVPFLVAGKYSHPQGELDFTTEVFDKMLQNVGVGDFDEGLDTKHNPDNAEGMLGWFSEGDGGWIQKEQKDGTLLTGYAKPTSEKALEKIRTKEFKYASVEFHPNYRSNLKQRYLSSDLLDSTLFIEEDVMEITLSQKDHDALTASAEKAVTLEGELTDIQGQLAEALRKISDLEAAVLKEVGLKEDALKEVKEAGLKESALEAKDPAVVALEAKIMSLQKRDVERDVALVLAEARIPVEGRGHSQAVLDACADFMLAKPLNDGSIKLEVEDDVAQIGRYNREFVKYLLTSILERTVQLDAKTAPAEPVKPNLLEAGKEFAKAAALWN